MYDNIDKDEIEKRLNEQIRCPILLKETARSFLYKIEGYKEYVLKRNKSGNASEEFENHKKIYDCWMLERENLDFVIPKPFFLSEDKTFYVMQYIDSFNLLERLMHDRDCGEIFRLAGKCVRQYHSLATKYLDETSENFLIYDTIKQLLEKKGADKIRECLDRFSEGSYRIIYTDLSLSNMILDKNGCIYFIDFQKIYYYAPFYYDLARFIDTGKVFFLLGKPLTFLVFRNKIDRVLRCFLEGYSVDLNMAELRRMQFLHRKGHIQMKLNRSRLEAMILKVIYSVVK